MKNTIGAVGELGCRGIKLALSYQAVDPMSDVAFRLFDRLQSDGLPIVFQQRNVGFT